MFWLNIAVAFVILLVMMAGVVGAALVLATREDAFEVANRKSKWVWCAILLGSVVACALYQIFGFIFAMVGTVFIGLYWFDVRPQIKDILDGTGGLY